MLCPKCGSGDLKVLLTQRGAAITKRVKRCKKCGVNFDTEERPILKSLGSLTKGEVEEYERFIAQESVKE